MSGKPEPKVLLMTLSRRTSGKGNTYLAGWLGKASVVAFPGEADKYGNPTWELFVATPRPRADQAAGDTAGGPRPGFFDANSARSHPLAREANNARSCTLVGEAGR